MEVSDVKIESYLVKFKPYSGSGVEEKDPFAWLTDNGTLYKFPPDQFEIFAFEINNALADTKEK